jgi:transposase-like protein
MMPPGLHGPSCDGTEIVRHGTSPEGKHRSRCRQYREGRGQTCLRAEAYAGPSPAIKQPIVERAINASDMRDTARVLPVSPPTILGRV